MSDDPGPPLLGECVEPWWDVLDDGTQVPWTQHTKHASERSLEDRELDERAWAAQGPGYYTEPLPRCRVCGKPIAGVWCADLDGRPYVPAGIVKLRRSEEQR